MSDFVGNIDCWFSHANVNLRSVASKLATPLCAALRAVARSMAERTSCCVGSPLP